MKRIKSFGVMQTAKVVGAMYLAITAVFMIPIGIVMGIVGNSQNFPGWLLIFAPVLYGLIGFIFCAIGCLIYNFVASKTGGIEVEID